MAKTRYISDSGDYGAIEAFQQTQHPDFWYVAIGSTVIDLQCNSEYGETTDIDHLITVLQKIKKTYEKEASKA